LDYNQSDFGLSVGFWIISWILDYQSDFGLSIGFWIISRILDYRRILDYQLDFNGLSVTHFSTGHILAVPGALRGISLLEAERCCFTKRELRARPGGAGRPARDQLRPAPSTGPGTVDRTRHRRPVPAPSTGPGTVDWSRHRRSVPVP